MLVPARYGEPIVQGSVDLLFRRWKRCQVVAGHVYRTAAGRLAVTTVELVDPARISAEDARRAGEADAEAVRRNLRGAAHLPTYRIQVRPDLGPDPRSVLAGTGRLSDEEVADIRCRLDRLDRASPTGPWTAATLDLIAGHPGTLAAQLAAGVGRERDPFKRDVRKLKALGLTESLRVGYRLSPRGRAWLSRTAGGPLGESG